MVPSGKPKAFGYAWLGEAMFSQPLEEKLLQHKYQPCTHFDIYLGARFCWHKNDTLWIRIFFIKPRRPSTMVLGGMFELSI